MNASGAVIPRPEILKERRKPRPTSRMSHENFFKLNNGDPHHACLVNTSFMLISHYTVFFNFQGALIP